MNPSKQKPNSLDSNPSDPSQNFFKLLTLKISAVNKKLLNEHIRRDSITRLEKDVIRNQKLEKPEKKNLGYPRLDMISLILNSDQKSKNEGKTGKLPKMPFGKHNNYNETGHSDMQMFFTTANDFNESKLEGLGDIKKKFRLSDKRQKNCKDSKVIKRRVSYLDFFDTFDMEHGELFCEKNENVALGYDRDKEKFRKVFFNSFDSTFDRKKVDRGSQKSSILRLYKNYTKKKSKRDVYYTSKYALLFDGGLDNEKKNRNGSVDITVTNL
jgi:hypothetical protein